MRIQLPPMWHKIKCKWDVNGGRNWAEWRQGRRMKTQYIFHGGGFARTLPFKFNSPLTLHNSTTWSLSNNLLGAHAQTLNSSHSLLYVCMHVFCGHMQIAHGNQIFYRLLSTSFPLMFSPAAHTSSFHVYPFLFKFAWAKYYHTSTSYSTVIFWFLWGQWLSLFSLHVRCTQSQVVKIIIFHWSIRSHKVFWR